MSRNTLSCLAAPVGVRLLVTGIRGAAGSLSLDESVTQIKWQFLPYRDRVAALTESYTLANSLIPV